MNWNGPGSRFSGLAARIVVLLLWMVAQVGMPALAHAESPRAPTVIMISLDGTRPADVTTERLPSLLAAGRRGVVAEGMHPSVPSNTFPNHVTLITGVVPARHGLVNNVFRDPERGVFEKEDIPSWIEVEPLWSLLAEAGISSAAFHWVGSEGPWRSGRGPRYWRPFSSRTPESEKVDQILAWLDLPESEGRPHFITSWFHGADHTGHLEGPDGEAVTRALRKQDRELARLIEGVEARGLLASTTLMFVSDHGMTTATRRVDVASVLDRAGIAARVYGIGGFASVVLARGGKARGSASPLDDALAVVREAGLDAFERDRAPAGIDVSNVRFGDFVVTAPIGTAITYRGLELEGFHGYAPGELSMAAIFIALGRGIPPGTSLPAFSNLDVAPSILALLGRPAPSWMQGKVIPLLEGRPDAVPVNP